MGQQMVSLGDLVLDLILPARLPVLPGEHQEPGFRRLEPGGAANLMVAARHMGVNVLAAGAVGNDIFGTQILDLLRQEKIDTSCVLPLPGTTTLVIVLTDQEKGEHVFLGNYGEGPEVPYPARLNQAIASADLMFMFGYTLADQRLVPMALRAIEQAAAVGLPMYLDVGPFMEMVPPDTIRWVLRQSALLLMTEDEIPLVSEGRTGKRATQYLLDSGPSTLVIKHGPRGCTVITRAHVEQVPGYHAKVVDTVGAGDCFAGAFVAGQLFGLSLRDSARLANAMGAAAVQKVGAGRNAPSCAEVRAVLQRAGEELNFPC